MKKTLKTILYAFLILCLLAGMAIGLFYHRFVVKAPKKEYPSPISLKEAQQQDLEYLTLYIEKDRSFDTPLKRNAFFDHIETLKSKIPMEGNAFLMGIAKVMAQANNTHTNIYPMFLAKRSNSIPLGCYWFGDDLHVVLAQKPFQPFLGTKIKRINGKTPPDLLKELENWYGGSTNRLKFFSPF